MQQVVIGCGEVGSAIAELLKADRHDLVFKAPKDRYDVMHVCFPYSPIFVDGVREYQKCFSPNLTVIHSTVPLGTSRACDAVHSPVRGRHPRLLESLRIFVKYFGGSRAGEAARLFRECECFCVPDQETTEALKLWDTTVYGVNISLEKEIYRWCQEHGVSFDVVYSHASETYNAGYRQLGMPQFSKYVLEHQDGPIGGHCVIPNAKLLSGWPAEVIFASEQKRTSSASHD